MILARASPEGPITDTGTISVAVPLYLTASDANPIVSATNTGTGYGILGLSNSASGYGVYGQAGAATGFTSGVYGRNFSTQGRGVYGWASAATGATLGVYGQSSSTQGRGVYGYAHRATGFTSGVYGRSDSTQGYGVHGFTSAATGATYALYGQSNSASGYGVYGYAPVASGVNYGMYGKSNSASGYGVYGENTGGLAGGFLGDVLVTGDLTISGSVAGTGTLGGLSCSEGEIAKLSSGVWTCAADADTNSGGTVTSVATGTGLTGGPITASGTISVTVPLGLSGSDPYEIVSAVNTGTGPGVYGETSATTDSAGIVGEATSVIGQVAGVAGTGYSPDGAGVYGSSQATTGGIGVFGEAQGTTGQSMGVRGVSASTAGYGVYGLASESQGVNYGVYGETAGGNGVGVYGLASATGSSNYGIFGQTESLGGIGILGINASSGSFGYFGGTTYGTYGQSNNASGRGVYGLSTSADGYGVYGYNNGGGLAGGFMGDVLVTGDLTVTGTFYGDGSGITGIGGGGTVTSVATDSSLTGGPITGSGTLGIATGGVALSHLNQNGCTTDQVMKWNGSAWACAADDDTLAGLGCTIDQIAKWNGSAWVCAENVDTAEYTEFFNAVANPSVSLPLSTAGSVGQYTSITIGWDGLPVISYYDGTNGDLKVLRCGHASCNESVFPNTITTVDSTGFVGQYTSIAIGTDSFPVISYQDITNVNLKVLRCGNTTCFPPASNTITTVDNTAAVGYYTSIAIGTDNFPVVSYYDGTNDDLKVLHCGNAACTASNTITTVDSTGDVGQYSSITIGTDGLPIISYYNTTNTDLKVLHCGNAACTASNTITTVDSTGNVGVYTSIAIGTDNFPVISYRDMSGSDLKVLHCGNTACTASNTITTVDSADSVGGYTSIAIGADGFPVISYFDYTYTDLKVLHCNNTICTASTTTRADNAGYIGWWSSITIATNGFPIISYYDPINNDLKVLNCTNKWCI